MGLIHYQRCYVTAKPDEEQGAPEYSTQPHPEGTRTSAARSTQRHTRQRSNVPPVGVPLNAPPATQQAIDDIGAPYAGWCFVFDTETTTDAAQTLRLGTYAVHGVDRDERMRRSLANTLTREGLDTLVEQGMFYNPAVLAPAEIATIEAYADAHDLQCMPVQQFIKDVFYRWVYGYQALCIGHNLPFDMSRLATRWGSADGAYRGGFWLKLCDCSPKGKRNECWNHPPIRIKYLGDMRARVGFRTVCPPNASPSEMEHRRRKRTFLDTATLARALDGAAPLSLDALGRHVGIAHPKHSAPEHGGAITFHYLDYAMGDVVATWECYQALREMFKRHGVQRRYAQDVGRNMWELYSQASLAKAYLEKLGVPKFMQQHKDFPKERLGEAMNAFYGGRSEVRIRLQPTEVVYCDFKSQYPTVNALIGLQKLLLAEQLDVRECTADVQQWLGGLTLEDLQRPETWQRLRAYVKVQPNGDLLPVRAEYKGGTPMIGLSYIHGPPTWYALADVVASWVLTGEVPEILEAWELVATGMVQTQSFALFGDAQHTLDLQHQDLFTEVINLRDRVKQQMRATDDTAEYQRLDGLQCALKVLANSGSYGVLVEVNQQEPTEKPKAIYVHGAGAAGMRARARVTETPGGYFAGPVGVLIPAGGRLLLALAERLAADRGMGYVFCDTDSIAFARPDGIERDTFRQLVQEVIDWFTPLSPYEGQPPILKYEKENDHEGAHEPLYAVAVSPKRYALYNRMPDGTVRIRKFSAHGVGMFGDIAGYTPLPHVPEPCADVQMLGGYRWHYDLWYDFILHAEYSEQVGDPYFVLQSDALNMPARFRVKACTADLLATYKHIPNIRPFSFFDVLPALQQSDLWGRNRFAIDATTGYPYDPYRGLVAVSFYAPRGGHEVRRSDTHELVQQIEHKTIGECVQQYFVHKAWTMEQPHGVGLLERRTVHVVGVRYVGKETNEIQADLYAQSGGVLGEDAMQQYAGDDAQAGMRALLEGCSLEALAAKTKIPLSTLHRYRNGGRMPTRAVTTLLKALNKTDGQHPQQRVRGHCKHCEAPTGSHRNKQYCSDACKMAAYRQRKTHPKEQAGA
jgi:hypothetical protein